MEYFQILKDRRSIRSYKKEPLPEELLDKVLEAARLAQSANNRQPWRFIIIQDETSKIKIAEFCKNSKWVADASVILAGVAVDTDYRMGNGRSASDIDLSIALTQISLAAVDQSLGTCWIGSFDYNEAMKFLKIPNNNIMVGFMTLGFPDESPSPRSRKSLNEITFHEFWEE
ncbi:MAG: nitroreductase [candidate division Zixibacteria bacterium]|nr:nitroreductase [candidate division Zixibacteria bacterium]